MPYDKSDPRTQLAAPTTAAAGVPRAAHYRELHESPPDETNTGGGTTWWTRSQAAVVGFTESRASDVLRTPAGIDAEHVLLVLDGSLRIDHESGPADVSEPSVVIVPPGESTITVDADGSFVRLFAADAAPDLAARCANAADYAEPDENVAPFTPWPDPPDGSRARVYPLSQHPLETGRLGRIFRCSTLMVNVFGDGDGPRDPAKLSPHHHDDFEQISLQVRGDYVHHMRRPWTPDSSTWADDEHQRCSAPAVVVIPPLLIHTSQSVEDMGHWLIDVFAPPRVDFSERPGWVLNAAEYPMPELVTTG